MNNRRNHLLNELYYQDRERYDFVIAKLGITHTVPKLGCIDLKPTRKSELRRLTKEYCDRIKEERLEEYHKELKTKRLTLREEIEKVDELIKQEEKYLGIQNPASSV